MKKKILGILVCTLMILPVLSITAIADPNTPDIWCSSIKGGRGIAVKIKNFGNETATNVEWRIRLRGGLIFRGSETTGTIESLAPEEEVTIHVKTFGFGRHVFRASSSILRNNLHILQTGFHVYLPEGSISMGAPFVFGPFIIFWIPYSYDDS
jgi:hypothetical protein